VIQYHLEFRIYDSEDPNAPLSPIYRDRAELDVATLRTISDYRAFDTLATILKSALLTEGSTVLELRVLAATPLDTVR